MDDIGRYLWSAFFLLLLTLIAMFFSASEVAVVSFSESKLKRLSDDENKKARALYRLKEHQFDFSLWTSTSAVLCMIAACAIGTYTFSPLLSARLAGGIQNAGLADLLALLIVFLIVTFLVMVFGQALPKKLVSYHHEEFAFFAISPIRAIGWLFRPLTWLILGAARLIVRLFGHDPARGNADVTEEEIRMLVDAGNESGAIELSERDMINNVFEFDDRSVGEIMTHRTDISAVSTGGKVAEVLRIALEEGLSRIPVYEGDIDNIVGILYAKDLLELAGQTDIEQKKIPEYMRPVIYVPESARCRMLFREFKASKVHMAVVVDEYGGTAGIATMEDLLESIVGSIQDEYDQEVDEIEKLDDFTYSFDGGVLIDKVEELFNTDLDADEDTDTLGGLIANTLGRIPQDGEMLSVVIKNIEFTVMFVTERRIIRVRARKLPEMELVEEKD